MTAPTDRTAEVPRPAVHAPGTPGAGEASSATPSGLASLQTPAASSHARHQGAAGHDPSRGGEEVAGGRDLGEGCSPATSSAKWPNAPRFGYCTCGHLVMFHNYGKRGGRTVRTGCSWAEGKKAVLCGCPLYEEAA